MWRIEFHKNAQKEFDDLSSEFVKKFEFMFNEVRFNGIQSLSSKSSKYVRNGIWEFRVIGRDGIARSLYVTEAERTVRILTVFVKKTEKIPSDKIELAQKRRDE